MFYGGIYKRAQNLRWLIETLAFRQHESISRLKFFGGNRGKCVKIFIKNGFKLYIRP